MKDVKHHKKGCCGVSQCVTVRCSVLRSVAVCCSVLHCVAVYRGCETIEGDVLQ